MRPAPPFSVELNLRLIRELAGGALPGVRVACLGVLFTFGADGLPVSDPLSPTLDLARKMHGDGAIVTLYDPKVPAGGHGPDPGLAYAGSMIAAVVGADVIALLTEWKQFRDADPNDFSRVVSQKRVFDALGTLDAADYLAKGWEYSAPARTADSDERQSGSVPIE